MALLHFTLHGHAQIQGKTFEIDVSKELPFGSWCVARTIAEALQKYLVSNPDFADRQADAIVLAMSLVTVGRPVNFYAPLFDSCERVKCGHKRRSPRKGVDHHGN